MAELVYSMLMSADGYLNDADGKYDFAMPSDEVFAETLVLARETALDIMGRRMYDEMAIWDEWTEHEQVDLRDYARAWVDGDKIVVSRTITEPRTARTRVVDALSVEDVERLKTEYDGIIAISGPTLAAPFIRAGLVDEFRLWAAPVLVGGGTRVLPEGARIGLELQESKAYADGMTYARYRPRR
jgi:dihydrofolate reductase